MHTSLWVWTDPYAFVTGDWENPFFFLSSEPTLKKGIIPSIVKSQESLDFSTYLKDKEAGAASKAKNVPNVDSTVSAGRDASLVEESAMGTSQIIEIEALPMILRLSVGIRPPVL